MKLVAQLKLMPDEQQQVALRSTLAAANAACEYASKVAFKQNARRVL